MTSRFSNTKIAQLLFSSIMTVLVLWHLLGNGYILTLDMVFGPNTNAILIQGILQNTLPLRYLLYCLTIIFGGIITQKILLITIFFLLFYLPLRYFKGIFKIEKTHGAEFVVATFFAINPFVYERFLVGQWAVVLGYALLVPVIAYTIALYQEQQTMHALKLAASLLILGAVSSHIFTMTILITAVVFMQLLLRTRAKRIVVQQLVVLATLVLMVSSYWLVPALFSRDTKQLDTFTPEHWTVFRTASNPAFGDVLGNVLSLHGFWGEGRAVMKQFVLPNDTHLQFLMTFAMFMLPILYGVYIGLRKKETRSMTTSLLILVIVTAIFSTGIGDGVFKNINLWLFEHVSFWKGFRDSGKWSAYIALGYALFAGLAAQHILARISNGHLKRSALYVLLAIPILYTPMMLFGFAEQLQPVHYPASWEKVNSLLQQTEDCKVLFLPWYGYYSLTHNNRLLTANTAASFFDCQVIQSKSMDMGGIQSQGHEGAEYDAINQIVTDNNRAPNQAILELKQYGFTHIIFTDDVVTEDRFVYPFLESTSLQPVITDNAGVYLYKVLW